MSLATVNKPSIFHSHFVLYIFYAALFAPNQNANEIFTLHMLLHVVRPSCDARDCDLLDLTRGLVQFDRLGHAYGMQSPVLYRTVWVWSRSCAKVSLIFLWNAVLKDEYWKKGGWKRVELPVQNFDFAVCWWLLADMWCVLCGQDLIQAPRTAEYQKQYAAVLLELETLNAVSQELSSVYSVLSLGLSLASVHSNNEKMRMPKLV